MAKAYKEICPCKDCKKRTANCHGKCKDYNKWKASGVEIEKVYFFETIKRRR